MMESSVYLDWAGAAKFTREHLSEVFEDLASSQYSNPHSNAKLTSEAIQQTRFRILEFFNTSFQEYSIIFTAGCTAALKLLSESFVFSTCPDCAKRDRKLKSDDFKWNKEASLVTPAFAYLSDNHTSVVGMRENCHDASIYCISPNELSWKGSTTRCDCNSLFVFPGMSNFCGRKYPLDWIERLHQGQLGNGRWYVCLDAAALVSTSPLDLKIYQPDFVTVSFYKIFGYPTGIGALLVRNSSAKVLRKKYFGGGTVLVSLSNANFFMPRSNLAERFEDGTVPYQQIVTLKYGFKAIEKIGGIRKISEKTFNLAQHVYRQLCSYKHSTGIPVAKVYCKSDFSDILLQGGIVNFNLVRPDGSVVGYNEVEKIMELHNIQLRTGCCCNQGACQYYLNLSDQEVLKNYRSGKTCGDHIDLIDGKPVGSVRISFGYLSTMEDADRFLTLIQNCFIDDSPVNNSESEQITEQINLTLSCEQIPVGSTSDAISEPHLSEILIYPVKSCGYFKVDTWPLCNTGFLWDRSFMVVNSDAAALTQKREPKLCLIKPSVTAKKLSLRSDLSKDVVEILLDANINAYQAKHCQTKVCQDEVFVADCGNDSAQFIDQILNRKGCRLVRQLIITPREIKGDQNISLANEGQFLLVNRSSARELLKIINGFNGNSLTEEELLYRFRPNLIVSNIEAFAEDNWQSVSIGDKIFEVTGRCTRCQMICIDQLNGDKNMDVLMSLKKLRDNELKFGIYLSLKSSADGSIRVGDRVLFD